MEIIESSVPPGFRFHPTEEELVGYYLKRKINDQKIDLDVIIDIDLYKMEPWDIQGSCRGGDYEEQNEWYFFSHKDRKYPTGTRTNRATSAGFWKATGRDKAVVSKNRVIGMRKTLVFYKGRAPNGSKTDWIMHEYRLQTSELGPPQEEGWVVCRAFKKPSPNQNQGIGPWNHHHQYHNPCYFKNNNNQYSISQNIMVNSDQISSIHPNYFGSNQQQDFMVNNSNTCLDINQFIELPNLESPTDETKDFEWNLLDNLLSSSQISQTPSSSCDQLNSQNQYCGFGNFVDL